MGVAGLWEAIRGPPARSPAPTASSRPNANALIAPIHDRMLVVLERPTGRCGSGNSPAILRCCCVRRRQTSCNVARLVTVKRDRSAVSCDGALQAARFSPSFLLPRATTTSASSARGRCSVSASLIGAVIQRSISSRVVRITGIAFG